MKLIFLILVCLGIQAQAKPETCAKTRTILVTGFEPFNGANDNGSRQVALELERLYGSDPCIRYRSCILPVEFGKAAEAAIRCYDSQPVKPDMVVSFGEGDCRVRLETRVHNLNNETMADNAGQVRRNQIIDPQAPENLDLPYLAPAMYCANPNSIGPFTLPSNSPGYYVCNDTAFRLFKHFDPQNIPYTFIHVPNSQCKMEKLEDTVSKIGGMTDAAIHFMETNFSRYSGRFSTFDPLQSRNGQNDIRNLSRVINNACQGEVRAAIERSRSEGQNLAYPGYSPGPSSRKGGGVQ